MESIRTGSAMASSMGDTLIRLGYIQSDTGNVTGFGRIVDWPSRDTALTTTSAVGSRVPARQRSTFVLGPPSVLATEDGDWLTSVVGSCPISSSAHCELCTRQRCVASMSVPEKLLNAFSSVRARSMVIG